MIGKDSLLRHLAFATLLALSAVSCTQREEAARPAKAVPSKQVAEDRPTSPAKEAAKTTPTLPKIRPATTPAPKTPTSPSAAPSSPVSATAKADLAVRGEAEQEAKSPPADIPPDVARVFDEMDRVFADSKARYADIRARIELQSAVRNYRSFTRIELKVQFPNLMNVKGVTVTETNDPETTTGWTRGRLPWMIISDGNLLFIRKGFSVTQKAPESLDKVLPERIELQSWGSDEIINCFLRTRPSTAFKRSLRRARLVQYTEDQIDLELVTAPPRYVQEKNEIPATFSIVHHVSIDAKRMIPKRCFIDMTDLSREIFRRKRQQEVPVERAFVEIIVKSVDIHADFSGQKIFVLPENAPRLKPRSSGKSKSLPLQPLGLNKP